MRTGGSGQGDGDQQESTDQRGGGGPHHQGGGGQLGAGHWPQRDQRREEDRQTERGIFKQTPDSQGQEQG